MKKCIILIISLTLIISLYIINRHPNKQNISNLKINFINYEYTVDKIQGKSVTLSKEYVETIEKFLRTNNNGILKNNTTENRGSIKSNRELFISSNKHAIYIISDSKDKNKFIIEFYSGSLLDDFDDSISNSENSHKQMEVNSLEMRKIFDELETNE